MGEIEAKRDPCGTASRKPWHAACRTALVAGLFWAVAATAALAQVKREGPQPNAAKEKPAAKAGTAAADKLAMDQQQIAGQFKRLEDLLLRMAELSASSDPRRAALLRKAVAQSKERLIAVQFETLIEILQQEQFSRAIENQGAVNKDLQSLLELLLSENRAKQLESEKARLRDYLKRLNALINQQKGIQGRTAGGGEPKGLADEQAKLAGKTGELARDVKAGEEASDKASGKPADADGKDGQGKDGQGKDGQGKEGQAKEGQAKEGQAKEGQGKGGQGKGQGQGKEDDQQEGGTPPSSQEQTPARKRLEAAQQRMREAEEKLKEAQRKGAVEKQEEAIRELEQAKAELEEILRQLREEEIERVLAMLEARFAKMLAMQRAVLEGTLKVDGVPREKRTRDHEVEAGRLSSREAEIDLEAEKATSLLREDGTAVAFPEALDQLRQDVRQVVQRLAEAKVDKITQGIEEDVIAALEEMIQALQKAQKDRQKKPPPPGTKPMEGEAQDPPLVDVLAELKMIRALQMRVNTRTERYSKLIEGEQARNPDLVEALRRLSERQERVYKITRDLHTGKNR